VCGKCKELGQKIKYTRERWTKNVAAAEKLVRVRKSRKCYAKMKEIKEKSKSEERVLGIPMDFMQNLPLPQIFLQEAFYFCKICTSDFGIKASNPVVTFLRLSRGNS
jgi:hypothetical protein